MFKPDQPIQSSKDDILGRKSFAQSLRNAILNYKEKDSIVIGLFGAWGSGKTSIINMAIEHIDYAYNQKINVNKPIIIKFNPWNFSDQNQLITQFFKQLSITLKRNDYASDVKSIGEKIETYAKFFEPLRLIPVVGQYIGIFKDVTENTGGALKSWGDLKENNLDSIRGELNDLLAKQSHKIIVIIDDIDRLNNTEIRQIFQLIKSLGDFPNTIYLLAFDKNVVINALQKVQEGFGSEYLEKIVQVPFDIPLISKQEVEGLLFNQLDELIKDIPEEKWDKTYWGNLYHSGLKYFFENIRDVTRYINSLRFNFGLVKGEVNPIDFLAITAIQVFIPEVYDGIRDNKNIFSGVFGTSYDGSSASKEYIQGRCDEIIKSTSKYPLEILKELLVKLFPKLESIYGNFTYNYIHMDIWRKDGRICTPDIFDRFFSLSIPKGEISQGEIDTILSLANNPSAFTEALLKLNEDGRIIRFLERMEDYTQKDIPEENIENIIIVLMDIGDLFPEGDAGFFGINTPMRILRLFYQLSHRFDSKEKRFNIFKNAIEKTTKSLYTVVNEVSVQGQQHGKYDPNKEPTPEEKQTVAPMQLEQLEKLACNKIEIWAENGRLSKHIHLPYILFRWKRWGNKEQINEFVDFMIQDDDGLINFITSFLSKTKSHGMSDYVIKINWQIPLESIKEFVDLKRIEPRIRNIFSSSGFKELDDNDKRKLAIKTFIDTIDGKIENNF
ncbi:MAG: AAA family ATPase [Planctomycetes bacterium]|nr:AAA family ATPase [Planctomycetota bacterium]